MAVTVLDTVNNQWFVQRKDGEFEPCHNAATAKTLCRQYNEEDQKAEKEEQYFRAFVRALDLQQQEVVSV